MTQPLNSSLAGTSTATGSAASAQLKTYLDVCLEHLHPSVIKKLESEAYWKDAAAKAAKASFTVLSVGFFIAVGIYAPLHFAITWIGFSALAIKVEEFVQDKWIRPSKYATDCAVVLKEIKKNYQDLTGSSPEDLQSMLHTMDIDWKSIPDMTQNPENLTTLKPLIAQQKFWGKRVLNAKQKKHQALQKVQKLATDYVKNKEEIYRLHEHAQKLDKEVLFSTLSQAFIMAVICKPTVTGKLESIGAFSTFHRKTA